MPQKFTKVLLTVELEGKAYGVELEDSSVVQLLHLATELSPNRKLTLYPMPNQRLFDVAFEKTAPHQ